MASLYAACRKYACAASHSSFGLADGRPERARAASSAGRSATDRSRILRSNNRCTAGLVRASADCRRRRSRRGNLAAADATRPAVAAGIPRSSAAAATETASLRSADVVVPRRIPTTDSAARSGFFWSSRRARRTAAT